jgi:putative transposase
MRFAFIDAQHANFRICALCRAMEVMRSGFHAWAVRLACARKRKDRVLAACIAAAFARSRRSYGSPRMLKELREDGHRVGKRRTARIMRENGLFARRRRAGSTWRR